MAKHRRPVHLGAVLVTSVMVLAVAGLVFSWWSGHPRRATLSAAAPTGPGAAFDADGAAEGARAFRSRQVGSGQVGSGGVGFQGEVGAFERRAVGVLRAWDLRRSHAYATGDVAGLRALYVPGAGAADVRTLEAYVGRRLRVVGMRMQLLGVEVLGADQRVLRVRVTDRLVGASVVRRGRATALPRDRPSIRVLTLRRDARGRWLMAAVS